MPAGSKFDVTPEEMNNSAKMITDKTVQFIQAYRDIYNAVNELNVEYKGEASQTFNERIRGYENDFKAAEKALTQYITFLEFYAKQVTDVETNIKNNASRLSVGN